MESRLKRQVVISSFLVVTCACSGKIDLGTLAGDGGGSPNPLDASLADAPNGQRASRAPDDAGYANDEDGDVTFDSGYYAEDSPYEPDDSPYEPDDSGLYSHEGGYDPYDGGYDSYDAAYYADGGFGGCSAFGPSCSCTATVDGHVFAIACESDATCNCYIDGTLTGSVQTGLSCLYDTSEIYAFCGFPSP
jgi:hypothetical protein